MSKRILLDDIEFAYPPQLIYDPSASSPAHPYAREPILRRMPDGSLACIHYTGGPTEPHDKNVAVITRSDDNGATWSAGEVLFEHPARGVWTTELFLEAGPPRLFVHTFCAGCHYLELKAAVSRFEGETSTWSEPQAVGGIPANFSVRRGNVLSNGTWIFPVYWQEQRGRWTWQPSDDGRFGADPSWVFCCGVIRSTDEGRSFSLHGCLRADANLWEPNVIETAPGQLLMLMRAEGANRLYRSDSTDGGLTWCPPYVTDIPSANSKLTLLKHGNRILLMHNPAEVPGWNNRRSLELWSSPDGGESWPNRTVLARVRDGIPKVICYPDGFVEEAESMLYVACDSAKKHYLMKVPLPRR